MSESTDKHDGGLGRREVLAGGAAGLGALVLGTRAVAAARAAVPASARLAASCVLSPEMTEGPYWIDESLTRRDVTEDVHGLPLVLRLTVVRATSCRPIKNADVEIWHAAPDGEYSGFDGNSGDALPARAPEVRRRRARALRHGVPGLVPRAHAAHPSQGPRRRRGGPHRPAVHEREGDPRGLPDPLLQGARPGRHLARRGHDLRRRRRPLDAADPPPPAAADVATSAASSWACGPRPAAARAPGRSSRPRPPARGGGSGARPSPRSPRSARRRRRR